jgi:hypothetical protein
VTHSSGDRAVPSHPTLREAYIVEIYTRHVDEIFIHVDFTGKAEN